MSIGCSESTDGPPSFKGSSHLEIHLVNGFKDDRVAVELDGKEIFDDVISTDPIVTLARAIAITVVNGNHDLAIEVNGNLRGTRRFTVVGELYIIVDQHLGTEPHIDFRFRSDQPVYF